MTRKTRRIRIQNYPHPRIVHVLVLWTMAFVVSACSSEPDCAPGAMCPPAGATTGGGGGEGGGAAHEALFTLSIDAPDLTALQGSEVSIGIAVHRDGGDFDVALEATTVPDGVIVEPSTVEAGSTTTTMTVIVGQDAAHGGPHPIVIAGRASGTTSEVAGTIFIRGAAGTIDQSFGTDGLVFTPGEATNEIKTAWHPAGRILVAATMGQEPRWVVDAFDEEGPLIRHSAGRGGYR